MPKRFTATEKWDDPWYSALTPTHRNFWDFLCDRCDMAGVWQVNMILVRAYFGADFELPNFGNRIVKISSEKWWLKKFVQFQYGTLNPSNRVHQAIISRLPKEGPCKDLISPFQGAKEKDKDKDKDKDAVNRKIPTNDTTSRIPPALEDVVAYCLERKNAVDVKRWFDFYASKGWMIGKNKMKDWRAAVRNWEKGSMQAEENNSKDYYAPFPDHWSDAKGFK